MTTEEIESLMNGLEIEPHESVTTIKYNENTNSFYRSVSGYKTEDEALFHHYYDEIKKSNLNIKAKQDDIQREQERIKSIYENFSNLFEKFSEELL